MIKLVTGTPGSGKTLELTRQIIFELLWTERTVVTNVPLVKEKLLPYLENELEKRKEWEGRVIDLDTRLVELDTNDCFEFFRYRSNGLVLPPPPDEDDMGRKMKKRDFELAFEQYVKPIFESRENMTPVTYFLSEAHKYFATADWASVGRSAQAYLTHHRHLHDEVVFDTQHYEQLAKQLRLLIAECWVVENHYKQQFGPFKKRGCFKIQKYLAKPGSGKPYRTTENNLDPGGIAACYKTTGALGGETAGERGPEEERKIKGLPWWMLWVFVGVGVLLVFLGVSQLPKLIGFGVNSIMGGVGSSVQKNLTPGQAQPPAEQEAPELRSPPPGVKPGQTPAQAIETQARIQNYVSAAIYTIGGTPFLSIELPDGRTITEKTPGIRLTAGRVLHYQGVEYHPPVERYAEN